MENLQIDKTFAIVKWWTSQKLQDKFLVFLVACIIFLTAVSVRLYSSNTDLHTENLSKRVEAEQRNTSSLQSQRNRDDSLRAEDKKLCELEKQEIYNRVGIIRERNDKIEKALK